VCVCDVSVSVYVVLKKLGAGAVIRDHHGYYLGAHQAFRRITEPEP
jgi:hypothetical protein